MVTRVAVGPLTVGEYGELARAVLEPGVWDFIAGGAGAERTLAANEAAFARAEVWPRVLTGGGPPDTRTRVLGRTWAAPIGIAPVAYHTMAHPDGEVATAQAAAAAGVPFVVSTFAGRTFTEIAAEPGTHWLQVYCFRDRTVTRRLIEGAEEAGFEALVLTVDAPRLGRRLRDLRGGFRLPDGIAPANLPGDGFGSPGEHALAEFDSGLDWSVVSWLRSVSTLPVLVKGVLTAAAARRAVAEGVDGIVVSNHGGRQLDGAPATLHALPRVVAAVDGACPVLLDGGVRRGVDVLVSLACGAAGVLLGRPVLHGLAADGRRGVERVLGIVIEELIDAMALAGVTCPADVGPDLISGR